jgi:hypothetical protein
MTCLKQTDSRFSTFTWMFGKLYIMSVHTITMRMCYANLFYVALLVSQQIDWLSQETNEHEVELNLWYKLLENYAVQVDDYITATNTLTSQSDTTGGKLIVPNLTAVHMVSYTQLFSKVPAVLLGAFAVVCKYS